MSEYQSDERGRDPNRGQGRGREPGEAEASRAVRAALDRWPGPEDTSDPRELAAAAIAAAQAVRAAPRDAYEAAPRPPHRSARRAWVGGLAAALLAFLALAMLGAELRRDGDRVSLSLRLPWRSPAESRSGALTSADSLAALEARVVTSARRATEEVAARMHEAHGLQLADWNRREEAQRRQLAAAVGRALQRERRSLVLHLDALGHGAAREDLRTREALAGLASYIVENEDR